MAFKTKWQFSFANIKNEVLTLSILADGYDGEVKSLTPSAHPFVTDDDDDSDILVPSRISTGYISVINRNDLDGLMPEGNLQHMVKLTNSEKTLWVGFMQAQSFGRNMYLEGEEVQFAVTDWLGSMDNVMMDVPETFTAKLFSQLIAEAIEKYDVITDIYLPPFQFSGFKNALHWLALSVNTRNFFTPNDAENTSDSDYEPYDRISYLKLLEKIVGTVGWTIHQNGTELWFLEVSNRLTYYRLKVSEINQWRDNPTGYVLPWSGGSTWDVTLEREDHASTDNIVETVNGYKSVKVISDPNATSAPSGNMSVSGMPFVRTRLYPDIATGDNRLRSHIYDNIHEGLYLPGYTAMPKYGISTEADITEVAYDPNREVAPQSRDLGSDLYSGYIITNAVRGDFYKQSEIRDGTKKSYKYSDGITVDYRYAFYSQEPDRATNPGYVFTMNNLKLFSFNAGALPLVGNGCIIINFSIGHEVTLHEAEFTIPVKLRVGDKYWNGSQWQTTEQKFNLTIKDGAVKNNKTIDLDYEDAEQGYLAPITNNLSGDMELTVYSNETIFPYSTSQYERQERVISYDGGVIFFSGISIKYVNKSEDNIIDKKDTSEFAAAGNPMYSDTKELTMKMSTELISLRNGFGTLGNGNSTLKPGDIVIDGKNTLEDILLDKMRHVYLQPSEQIKPTLLQDIEDLTICGCKVIWNGNYYHVAARSIDWRDCTNKLLTFKVDNP